MRSLSIPLKGAVGARSLLSLLRKLKDKTLEVSTKKGEIILKGINKMAGIKLDAHITMPFGSITPPGKWFKLSPNFSKGLSIVYGCCSRDVAELVYTGVHCTSEFVEATDSFHAARYKVKLPFRNPILINSLLAKYVAAMKPIACSEAKKWIYFKNKEGLTIIGRRGTEEYPDIVDFLTVKGKPIKFPASRIKAAAERAEIFSSEESSNLLEITIKKNRMSILSVGESGWYKELKKAEVNIPSVSFAIPPYMLTEICKRTNNPLICERSLKVEGENYIYVSSVGQLE